MFTILVAERGYYSLSEPFIAQIKGFTPSRGLDRDFIKAQWIWDLKRSAAKTRAVISDPGIYEVRNCNSNAPSSFEPRERGVDSAQRNIAAATCLDLASDRDSRCIAARPHDSQQYQQF